MPADPIHLLDVTPLPTTYPVSGMLSVRVRPCAPVPVVTLTMRSREPPLAICIAGEVHVKVTIPFVAEVCAEPSGVEPSESKRLMDSMSWPEPNVAVPPSLIATLL